MRVLPWIIGLLALVGGFMMARPKVTTPPGGSVVVRGRCALLDIETTYDQFDAYVRTGGDPPTVDFGRIDTPCVKALLGRWVCGHSVDAPRAETIRSIDVGAQVLREIPEGQWVEAIGPDATPADCLMLFWIMQALACRESRDLSGVAWNDFLPSLLKDTRLFDRPLNRCGEVDSCSIWVRHELSRLKGDGGAIRSRPEAALGLGAYVMESGEFLSSYSALFGRYYRRGADSAWRKPLENHMLLSDRHARRVFAFIVSAAQGPDEELALTAITSLSLIRLPGVAEVLTAIVDDPVHSASVRGRALIRLAEAAPERALDRVADVRCLPGAQVELDVVTALTNIVLTRSSPACDRGRELLLECAETSPRGEVRTLAVDDLLFACGSADIVEWARSLASRESAEERAYIESLIVRHTSDKNRPR